MKKRPVQNARGAILIIAAIIMAVLIGVAALVLDVGRLLVLRTEMQNAVDAAALAGAKELNGRENAIQRARAAAIGLLLHQSHFAKAGDKKLLDLDEADITFEFYCSIGGKYDGDGLCAGDPKTPITEDVNAHYIKVTLNKDATNEPGDAPRYTIDLIFLPVLSAFNQATDETKTAATSTSALAGRHFFMCNYPPLMMCDPFELSGGFRDNVSPGQQILLKVQTGSGKEEYGFEGSKAWAPGDFGFLDPEPEDKKSKVKGNDLKVAFAIDPANDCDPPIIRPITGAHTGPLAAAINTRFDVYGPPNPFNKPDASSNWPPAPNIMNYNRLSGDDPDTTNPFRDSVFTARVGNGIWDRALYWETFHSTKVHPVGYLTMKRWDVYNWEIDNDYTPDPVGKPTHTPSSLGAERRRMYMSVTSCNALGVKGGGNTYPIVEPDGFAEVFYTECVGCGTKGSSDTDIFVEFIGWVTQADANYHVEVMLYE